MQRSIKPVRELYGLTPAAEFGPLALKATREVMVRRGWCRKLVNQRVNRVRRIFKWAVAEELVPPAVHQALAALPGLQRGRSGVRDPEPGMHWKKLPVKLASPSLRHC